MADKIVHDTIEKISIYANTLSISQQDIPYDASVATRPASQKGFYAAADVITITEDLFNPGQEITLIAREIILAKQLSLDAGGPGPDKTFAAGDLPPQPDTSFGATGANGQDATGGLPAGQLTLSAASIHLSTATANGASQVISINGLAQQSVLQATPIIQKSSAISQVPFSGFVLSMPWFTGKIVHFKLTDASIKGLQNVAFADVRVDKATKDIILSLHFSGLVVNTGKVTYEGIPLLSDPIDSAPFDLTTYTWISPGVAGYTLQQTKMELPQLSFKDPNNDKLTVSYNPEDGDGLDDIFKTVIGKEIVAQINSIATNIALWLHCQGGDGGRGQDGHDGIVGQKGANGVKTATHGLMTQNGVIISTPEEAEGKPGKPGGQAGSAGHSLAAVAGGAVNFNLVNAIGSNTVVLSAAGGIGGAKASPGQPGAGGAGGTGADCVWDIVGEPGQVNSGNAGDGKNGDQGAAANFAGDQGANGGAGLSKFNGVALPNQVVPISGSSYDRLAVQTPLTTLQIKQQATNLAYLNAQTASDYQEVAVGYHWLMQINAPFVNNQDPSAGKLSPDDLAVRRNMYQSAQTELSRMQQGLDYFGHTMNWVPVLSMNALKGRIQDLLGLGKIIEDTYNAFNQENATIEQQLDQFSTMQTKLKNAISDDTNQIATLNTQIADTSTKIDNLLAAINAQMDWIVTDEYAYKQQLENYLIDQATKCTWASFFKALFTIIKDAAEVVSGIGEVQEAISGFSEVKNIFGAAKKVVTIIKKAEATVKSIEEVYNELTPKLGDAPDSAKILVDQDKFDEMVKQYLGKFPAAEEFKDAVDHYFDLIKTHNRLALAYTGLWVQKLRLQADIDQKNAELEHVAAQSVVGAKLIPPSIINFMYNAYWNTKTTLLRELYQFNRAYEFWSLESRAFLSSDLTIANLADTFITWSNDIDSFLEQSGPFQPFTEVVTINASNAPAAFRLLPSSKRLNFLINIQDMASYGFANMTHINATSVKVELPDIQSTSNVAFLDLTHNGTSQQNSSTELSAATSIHTFTHAARSIPYKIDYANPGNTAGGLIGDDKQGFPGLSPFTLWTLNFDLQGNDWIDLTKITEVKLTFTGKFLGPGSLAQR